MFMQQMCWSSFSKTQKWHFLRVLAGEFVFHIMSLNICKRQQNLYYPANLKKGTMHSPESLKDGI